MDPFVNDEETLDPQDWDAMRSLGHRMVDDMLTWLETVRERKVWQPVPAAGESPPAAAAAAGGRAAGGNLRGFPQQHPAVSDGQRSSALLELGDGERHRARDAGRDAGGRFQPEHGRRRARGHLRRAAGARLDEADARLSPGGERPVGERRVDGEPGGPRGRAQCAGRLRCAPRGAAGLPAAADVLHVQRGAQLHSEGRRAAWAGRRKPASAAGG